MAKMKAGQVKAIEGPGAIKAEAEAEEKIAQDRQRRLMLAQRYGTPVVDEPVDVETERKKWERDEVERARTHVDELERGKRERFHGDERVGANPAAVAAAIAAKVKAAVKPEPSEEELARHRKAEIATAMAQRYGRIMEQ